MKINKNKPTILDILPVNVKVPIKQLKRASTKVRKTIENHFKKDSWDLRYSFLVDEIFYEAFGHHLENYLLNTLSTSKKYKYVLKNKDGNLVINICKGKKK